MQENKRKEITLDGVTVGSTNEVYFIAEVGNNHNGDYYLAKKTIEEAAKAGAQAVKLQKRFIDETFAKELSEKQQTGDVIKGSTYGEYREGLELSVEEFKKLKKVAADNGVSFFATPFDIKSVDFLEEVGVSFYKIASFDLTNLPLLEYVAALKKPIILSTGMATESEVEEAVNLIMKYHSEIVLLHCVSIYPTPDEHINLGMMRALMQKYPDLQVGYSGHEEDILATLVSVAQGATVVERHFTLSRYLPGPDHGTVSIDPNTFHQMVTDASRIKKMQGSEDIELLEGEEKSRAKHSKSVVAACKIPKGTIISEEMLTVKSPGYGYKPRDINLIVNKKAANEINVDQVILEENIQ